MNQSLALEIMLSGQNVFLTGAAGAGKTYVLNSFIKHAKKQKRNLAVTATTGLAATHLGGNTIHAWSGLGIYDDLPNNFFNKMSKNRYDQIQKADVLIIDEISMLHDFRLDLIDVICQKVRDDFSKPFGGLQVIFSGDFFQLPPVNRKDSKPGKFAPFANSWSLLDPTVCYLDEQHRQDDADYLEILNALRNNDLRRRHAERLLSRVNTELATDSLTELHTTNINVDRLNHTRLGSLSAEEFTYEMSTTGSANYVETLKRSCLAPEELRIKVGALVMALKNHPNRKYSNGSVGTVVGFDSFEYPIVEFKNGNTVAMAPDTWELRDGNTKRASLTQIPLRLAWAITVHKSQGMTLDAARVDLRRAFEPGMGYVALSRVKSLESLSLVGINRTALTVSPEALELDKEFRKKSAEAAKINAHLVNRETSRLRHSELVPESKKSKKTTSDDPEKAARSEAYKEKIEKLRKTVPNAMRPWTLEDSDSLIEKYLAGESIEKLAKTFGRKPRAIMLRLNTSFGEELYTKDDIKSLINSKN